MKTFGLCCANHEEQSIDGVVLPFLYYTFDEDGLRLWLKKQQITIADTCITDAEVGTTHCFMARYNFVFWRIE